ncbi:hypothetical protein SAMN02799615_03348 [Dyella marensis]|jgi:hypothetical protein|uniref:Secreted protein n=2 Tax=Rhodanobacteraceae TaxID=1775411 RepID=A0A1I2I865_9GAMM|nr:hypothetical protein SAMN02799615_03348 [Dyella marensis]
MRPGLRTKRVVFALIGGMLISGYAWAVNPGKVNVKNSYYSDASLTTRVGERDYNCQGNLYSWGYQTMYQTFTAQDCPDTSGGINTGGDGGPSGPPTCTLTYTPYPEAICTGG